MSPTLKFSTSTSTACGPACAPAPHRRRGDVDRDGALVAVRAEVVGGFGGLGAGAVAAGTAGPSRACRRRRGGRRARGRSTLITSAPRSASVWVHQGPASTRDRSSTRTPASAIGVGRLAGIRHAPIVGERVEIIGRMQTARAPSTRPAGAGGGAGRRSRTVACSPALDWREARPAGSGVSLLFPCRPERQERTGPRSAPPCCRCSCDSCRAGGATFRSGLSSTPPTPAQVTPLLDALRRQALGQPDGGATETPLPAIVPGATPNPGQRRVSRSSGPARRRAACRRACGLLR